VARQFTQCGNAVPPVLAYEMACAIYSSIYANIKGGKRSAKIGRYVSSKHLGIKTTSYPQKERLVQLHLAVEKRKKFGGAKGSKSQKVVKSRYNRKSING
jgi:hypothetical protein